MLVVQFLDHLRRLDPKSFRHVHRKNNGQDATERKGCHYRQIYRLAKGHHSRYDHDSNATGDGCPLKGEPPHLVGKDLILDHAEVAICDRDHKSEAEQSHRLEQLSPGAALLPAGK